MNKGGVAIRLAGLFSEHAVLQRDMPAPVWGWTRPGLRVGIALGPYTAETRADDNGKFLARLPPMPAGGPYEMKVTAADTEVYASVGDVMVGEVWVCSGQSNMQWPIREMPFDPLTLSDTDTLVRMLTVPQRAAIGRRSDVDAAWRTATPAAVPDFSAVGFFFGRRLARELGVAVGLINTSWGGTRIEAWMSREELVRHRSTRSEVARYESSVSSPDYWSRFGWVDPAVPDSTAQLEQEFYPRDPGNTGFGAGWADVGCDDGDWVPVEQPGSWVRLGYETNGVFWFRRELTIPEDWTGKDLTLGLGAVDKQDTSYFNGEQVGATGRGVEQEHWCVPRMYNVPGRLVKAGRAVVAVRAYSFLYDGGLIGPAEKMVVGPADGSSAPVSLAGVWRMKIEHDFGKTQPLAVPFGPCNHQTPYILNDNMVQPLIPYAVRGATWYQGESNESNPREYGRLLRALIRDWRRAWGQGDFPFLTVQLANFKQPLSYEPGSPWALLREGQLRSLQVANTGLAVAVDIGDALDVHPRNKLDVGERLAQWALARSYGRKIVPSGPLYRDFVVEGDRIRVRFDHTGGGLTARGGKLRTFAIAGIDRKFMAAEAVIDGDTVLLRSQAVPEPLAARYAWADNPDGCNLYNREGLPASPFRTDAWRGSEK